MKRGQERVAYLHLEGREVLVREQSAVVLMERGDRASDLAPVEGVARGDHASRAVAGGRLFGTDHRAERLRELGLHEDLAGPEGSAVAEKQRGRRRPAPVRGLVTRHQEAREARE